MNAGVFGEPVGSAASPPTHLTVFVNVTIATPTPGLNVTEPAARSGFGLGGFVRVPFWTSMLCTWAGAIWFSVTVIAGGLPFGLTTGTFRSTPVQLGYGGCTVVCPAVSCVCGTPSTETVKL